MSKGYALPRVDLLRCLHFPSVSLRTTSNVALSVDIREFRAETVPVGVVLREGAPIGERVPARAHGAVEVVGEFGFGGEVLRQSVAAEATQEPRRGVVLGAPCSECDDRPCIALPRHVTHVLCVLGQSGLSPTLRVLLVRLRMDREGASLSVSRPILLRVSVHSEHLARRAPPSCRQVSRHAACDSRGRNSPQCHWVQTALHRELAPPRPDIPKLGASRTHLDQIWTDFDQMCSDIDQLWTSLGEVWRHRSSSPKFGHAFQISTTFGRKPPN